MKKTFFKLCPTEVVNSAWPSYCYYIQHDTTLVLLYSIVPLYTSLDLPKASLWALLTMRPPYCHCAHYETSLLPLYSPWDLSIATVLTMRPPYCHCTHHDTSLLPLYSPWDLPIATVLTMIPLYCQWCRWVRWCWSDNRSSPWTKNTLELE